MKILVITSDYPFPANHGGRLDVFTRLKKLKALGHSITLIYTVKDEKVKIEKIPIELDDCMGVVRTKSLLDIISILPFQVKSRRKIEKIDLSGHFDILLIETEYVGGILRNSQLSFDKCFLRLQNNDPEYFRELGKSSKSMDKKLFYASESIKFMFYSRNIRHHVDKTLFISRDEYERDQSSLNSVWLPPSVEIKNKSISTGKDIVWIGSLFMENNIYGLRWFIKEVYPLIHDRLGDRDIIIAGNSRGEKVNLEFSKLDSRFKIIDSPQNIEEIYAMGAVFIAPIFHGAGVKMKTLDAISHGLPVITTSKGAEGTGLINGYSISLADNKYDFAQEIMNHLSIKNYSAFLHSNAISFIEDKYNNLEELSKIFS